MSLDLWQTNVFFNADGDIEFFLATDTRFVDLSDPARFIQNQPTGNTGADVVGTAFGTLFSLGTGTYTQTADFDNDNFVFSLDAEAEAFAISQINSGGVLRIIATPADVSVAATYAGANFPFLDDAPFLPFPVLNVSATSGMAIKGDVNNDGDVNFFDVGEFISVLQSGLFQAEADCDCSGTVDFGDIPAFIVILQHQ